MRKLTQGRFYRVHWEDAFSRDQWGSPEAIAEFGNDREACICHVTGELIADTNHALVLAAMGSPGGDRSMLARIPKPAITKVEPLAISKPIPNSEGPRTRSGRNPALTPGSRPGRENGTN